jgi:hypothetical protein
VPHRQHAQTSQLLENKLKVGLIYQCSHYIVYILCLEGDSTLSFKF